MHTNPLVLLLHPLFRQGVARFVDLNVDSQAFGRAFTSLKSIPIS
jgi:hypothetical protein